MAENVHMNAQNDLAAAIKNFEDEHKEKSFSGRHSELGKMMKCQICNRRHRSAIECIQRFALDENEIPRTGSNIPGQAHQTRRGALGVLDNSKGKRILPHHSSQLLQLVQLTQDMFPAEQPFWPTPEEAMRRARTLSGRILRRKRARIDRAVQRQQDVSRRINVGLLAPGSR